MSHVKRRHHSKRLTKKKSVVEPSETPYHGPYGDRPLSHIGYREGRHLHPGRLPTPIGSERVVSLRLLDISKETVDNVQHLSSTLRRLQLCRLRLQKIPGCLVANLVHLRKLDLSENELVDNSFPDAIADLESLVELRLNSNKLTKLPACLKKLKNLSRLDLGNNNLEAINGIDKLRKIQILVLDGNKLSSVIREISNLIHLEILSCNNNRITDIPHDVRHLQSLSDVDISNNRLKVLNPEVFKLPNLDAFNASQNDISKIPSFNVQLHHKKWISILDISNNNLTKFPAHLLQMTNQLDISSNNIKVLSWNAIKKLDPEIDQELDVRDNPISYPPLSVCESGLKSVSQFFQETRIDAKTYQGIKILVLGSHRSGKTSLVQSIVDQQSRITRDVDEISAGINSFETTFDYDVEDGCPGKQLQLNIWDFCGHSYYNYPNYVFFEESAITILTFNMAKYREIDFYEMIGSWFDWMITKTNKLVVLLVATHCDLVPTGKIKLVCDSVCDQLKSHMNQRRKLIEDKIKTIEEQMFISPTLSEQLKSYTFLLRSKFSVQTNVIVTSAAKYKGFDKLIKAIESLSNDRKLFPHVMRVIPSIWVNIENYLEDRGNSLVVPVLSWDEYINEVTGKFGMKHILRDITTYLHETGKVIWFGHNKYLKNYVFLRPQWLFDILKLIYNHNASEILTYDMDDQFKSVNISQTKFDRLKRDLLSQGILNIDLMKILSIPNLHCDNNLSSFVQKALNVLVEAFEIGYPVTKRPKDLTVTFTVDQKNDQDKPNKKFIEYLIPWLRSTIQPETSSSKWESISHRRSLAIHYSFPRYLPPGLFHIISVRFHRKGFKLRYVAHWANGVHAEHEEHLVRLLVEADEGNKSGGIIRLSVRDDTDGEDEVPISTMWTLLIPLLDEIDDLLKDYTGVLVDKSVGCPYCKEPSFVGEWASPKETQAVNIKVCCCCGEDVDTNHLVQPKTKTRDAILLNIRSKKGKRRDATVVEPVISSRRLLHRKKRASVPNLSSGRTIPNFSTRRKSTNDHI